MTETQELSTHLVIHLEKRTTPQRCYFGTNAADRPLSRNGGSTTLPERPAGYSQAQQRDTQNNESDKFQSAAQPLN